MTGPSISPGRVALGGAVARDGRGEQLQCVEATTAVKNHPASTTIGGATPEATRSAKNSNSTANPPNTTENTPSQTLRSLGRGESGSASVKDVVSGNDYEGKLFALVEELERKVASVVEAQTEILELLRERKNLEKLNS